VSFPLFAILSRPGWVCLTVKFSSANFPPYIENVPVPSPLIKSPPWIINVGTTLYCSTYDLVNEVIQSRIFGSERTDETWHSYSLAEARVTCFASQPISCQNNQTPCKNLSASSPAITLKNASDAHSPHFTGAQLSEILGSPFRNRKVSARATCKYVHRHRESEPTLAQYHQTTPS
jgi:hypothetical protein